VLDAVDTVCVQTGVERNIDDEDGGSVRIQHMLAMMSSWAMVITCTLMRISLMATSRTAPAKTMWNRQKRFSSWLSLA